MHCGQSYKNKIYYKCEKGVAYLQEHLSNKNAKSLKYTNGKTVIKLHKHFLQRCRDDNIVENVCVISYQHFNRFTISIFYLSNKLTIYTKLYIFCVLFS